MKEVFFIPQVERVVMNKKRAIELIVHVAIFGALSIILYCVPFLQFSLPFAPSFLKIHFDEIPILLCAYTFGPLEAGIIIILKGLVKLIQDIPANGGIGVLADILYTSAFIFPACLIYRRKRTFKFAIISLIVGIISQLIVSCVLGLYLIYPLYGFFFNPLASSYDEAMEFVGKLFAVFDNSIVTAKDPRIMYMFLLPFNGLKDAIVGLVTFACYKPLKLLIEKK